MSTSPSPNDHIYTFLTSISITGTIGNLIVACVYWKKLDKQTSTFFILFLAFIDLTVCSVLVPTTIFMEKIYFITDNRLFCKSYFFLMTTSVPMSSLLMTAIAFDRYFCICKVNSQFMTLSRARFIGIVLLVISACLGVIPALATTTEAISFAPSNTSSSNHSAGGDPQCRIDTNDSSHFGFLVMPFKFFYDFIFIACVITITVLYILIYSEIYTRRKAKRDRRRELFYNSFLNTGFSILNSPPKNEPDNSTKSFFFRFLFRDHASKLQKDDLNETQGNIIPPKSSSYRYNFVISGLNTVRYIFF